MMIGYGDRYRYIQEEGKYFINREHIYKSTVCRFSQLRKYGKRRKFTVSWLSDISYNDKYFDIPIA